MVRIAGLPVWGPSDMIAGARAVMGWTDEAVAVVAALPERVSTMLDDVEELLARVNAVAERAERLVANVDGVVAGATAIIARAGEVADRAGVVVAGAGDVAEQAAVVVRTAGGVATSAGGVIEQATAVAGRAGGLVDEAAGTSRVASELLGLYQPIAERGAPLAKRFVEELSEAEVEAAIKLVDQVPLFAEHMITDIMPILSTLDRVGPDVHQLLDVLEDVRHAIQGVPGFNLLRRRGKREDENASDDD